MDDPLLGNAGKACEEHELQPTNAGVRKCQKGWFCPINRLYYDSTISELILVAICSRSLAQSFVISLTLASFMQHLQKPQRNKHLSLTSGALIYTLQHMRRRSSRVYFLAF